MHICQIIELFGLVVLVNVFGIYILFMLMAHNVTWCLFKDTRGWHMSGYLVKDWGLEGEGIMAGEDICRVSLILQTWMLL